jgi:hypothetical protein
MDRFDFDKGLTTIRYLDSFYRQSPYADIILQNGAAAARTRRRRGGRGKDTSSSQQQSEEEKEGNMISDMTAAAINLDIIPESFNLVENQEQYMQLGKELK